MVVRIFQNFFHNVSENVHFLRKTTTFMERNLTLLFDSTLRSLLAPFVSKKVFNLLSQKVFLQSLYHHSLLSCHSKKSKSFLAQDLTPKLLFLAGAFCLIPLVFGYFNPVLLAVGVTLSSVIIFMQLSKDYKKASNGRFNKSCHLILKGKWTAYALNYFGIFLIPMSCLLLLAVSFLQSVGLIKQTKDFIVVQKILEEPAKTISCLTFSSVIKKELLGGLNQSHTHQDPTERNAQTNPLIHSINQRAYECLASCLGRKVSSRSA